MGTREKMWKVTVVLFVTLCSCTVLTYEKVFHTSDTQNQLSGRIVDKVSVIFSADAQKFKVSAVGEDSELPDDGASEKALTRNDRLKSSREVNEFDFYDARKRGRRSSDTLPEQSLLDFSFSEWGHWTNCNSKNCAVRGHQWKSRTCYGSNLNAQSHHPCTYENLVRSRPCYPDRCAGSAAAQRSGWSEWTSWDQCSVTCGKGGEQTRARSCVTINNHGISAQMCSGRDTEKRDCQYSVSCPMQDKWTAWSGCSRTCGEPGVSYRKRNCFVYRYFYPGTSETTGSSQSPGNHNPSNANSSPRGTAQGKIGATILHNGSPVYIVDAIQDLNNPILNIDNTSRETIGATKCLNKNESFEEQRPCNLKVSCPSQWGQWHKWSTCRRGCSPGIRKRERTCILNSKQEPCKGQKALYRRCYPPPCWSTWENIGSCSATCGTGLQIRARRCRLYSTIPPFDKCIGSRKGVVNCSVEACTNECWTNWEPFAACTVSCNSGFQFRNRTCICQSCHGDSNEIRLCNKQRCPTWSRWGPYSCCSVSCGSGIRNRTRSCINGNIGDMGCNGTTSEVHICYRPPCENAKTSAFQDMPCGTRPRSTLKNVAHLRIFGGAISIPHGWPWQASWQHRIDDSPKWTHFCGGSLIQSRWVLTAAHCIEEAPSIIDHDEPGLHWSIVLGMDRLYQDGTRFFAEKIFVHVEYLHELVTFHDIALIKLRRMASITENISPICLPGTLGPEPGESCIVSGWGFTEPHGNHSESLKEASVPVVDFDTCRKLGDYYRYFLTETVHLCAGNPVHLRNDSCMGDSGGPLSCKEGNQWYLAGVTSFSFAECGTFGHTGIYTPVISYEKWIRDIVEFHTYAKC